MRESFAAGALLLTVAAGAGADATLTYRLATGTEQEAQQLRIAVVRFFSSEREPRCQGDSRLVENCRGGGWPTSSEAKPQTDES